MEIITKETIKKLRKELVLEFEPIGLQMRKEGCNDRAIIRAIEAHKQVKIKRFYKTPEENIFKKTVMNLIVKEDSRVEMVFYNLLERDGIPFNFQVKIGPYRVDFLIANYLVFEGDGPCHATIKEKDNIKDNYLKKMGYKVFRLSWELVAQLPDRVLDVIKEDLKNNKIIITDAFDLKKIKAKELVKEIG